MPHQRPSPPRPIRVRSRASLRLIERLRKICLALPQANEKLSHGEPTWFAGKGKVFATVDDHHHGSPHLSVWLPAPLGAQEALIDADPARFFRPPYVGVSGWVGVVLDTKPDWGVVAGLVREAYLHVATAKLRKALLDAEERSGRAPRPAPRGKGHGVRRQQPRSDPRSEPTRGFASREASEAESRVRSQPRSSKPS